MTTINDLVAKIENNQKINTEKKREYNSKKPGNSDNRFNKKEQKRGNENNETKKTEQRDRRTEKTSERSTGKSSEKQALRNTNKSNNKPKSKKNIKKKFYVAKVCMSQKSCGKHYAPYVWERLCNDYNQDPECDSFEIQGFQFEKSPCQGACKKPANIRIKEEGSTKHTQFSYITPLKASKLIKNIKSGAAPENIKNLR